MTIGQRTLFFAIELTIAPGGRLAILGPNGAGKTSLLNILSGLGERRFGSVYYSGLPVHAEDRRLSIGSQFSNFPAFMRVKELLKIFELSRKTKVNNALYCLRKLIKPCFNSYYQQLSGGERKLVIDYLALGLESECLLLDEPTSSLDVIAANRVNQLLQEETRTLIFSSHDLREAIKISRQVLFLTGKQGFYFDLRNGELFDLYCQQTNQQQQPAEFCQHFSVDQTKYCILPSDKGKLNDSWQHQGQFSPTLLLYNIFNIIRNSEEKTYES